jgi:hypothetical protein
VRGWHKGVAPAAVFSRQEIDSCIVLHKKVH